MTVPHPLDKLLEDGGIKKYLESRKEVLHNMLVSLYGIYHEYNKQKVKNNSLIENFVWETIRNDPQITRFFVTTEDYMYELTRNLNEGLLSSRLVEMIFEIVTNEYGDDFTNYQD